jgi:hypothetical protein
VPGLGIQFLDPGQWTGSPSTPPASKAGWRHAQKGAWDAYTDALKRNLQSMQGMGQMMKTVFEAKTPVERLDAHLAAMETRVKTLQDVKPVLAKLYEALSAEQKKKADEILTGMGCKM